MSLKERLIQLTLKARDLFSGEVEKSASAVDELTEKAKELKEQLADTTRARGLARVLRDNEEAADGLKQAMEDAKGNLADLTREVEQSEDVTAGQSIALREAKRAVDESARAYERNQRAITNVRSELKALGVDVESDMTEAERMLTAKLEENKRALDENREAIKRKREEEKAAAKSSSDLGSIEGEALARHREAIASQSELNDQTATYGERLRDTARSMAAYVAGFFAIDAAVTAVRSGITEMLKAGDKTEHLANQMEAMMGSIKGGEQATAWIKEFAKTTPLAVADVTEAFAQLKTFGVDPMGGALQALVDQNEKLGGGQDRLLGLVTAVGQAWGKQKLQTEEILQLVERGVPAWDMLATVTGKNTAQLMEMASAGQLGRDAITGLLDEMARGASGAAAANMSTLTGLASQLGDVWQGFLSKVADSGALDYAKGRMQALLDTIERMGADGSLDAMAKSWSDRFITLASSIEGAGQWIGRHIGDMKALAAAYAAFKIAGLVTAMVNWGASVQRSALQVRVMTAETDAATAATVRLTAAQRASALAAGALGKASPVVSAGLSKVGEVGAKAAVGMLSLATRLNVYAAAAYLAAEGGAALGEWLGKHSQAAKDADAAIERNRQQMLAQYDQALQTAQGMKVVTDVQVKSTAELRKASDSEREGYRERLKALEEYQKAQLKTAIYGKEAGKVTEQEYQKAAAALASTRKALADLEPAAKAAADALKGDLTTGALGLVEKFNELKRSGKDVDEVLAELGKGFDPRNAEQLRDMGQTLQYLGQYGVLSGDQIQQFLSERLEKLSGEELVRLQQVAQQVFTGMGRDAQALGLTMDASLNTALAKLGLDLEQINTGFDKGTREIIDGFDQVIAQTAASGKSAEDSARIIVAAFQSAREKIDDPDALKQLEGAYKAWQGTSTEAAMAARSRMSELQTEAKESAKAITGMEDALTKVGAAANAMELANIGVAASRAFHEGRMSAEQYAKVQDAIKAKYTELGTAAREAGQAAEQSAEQGTKSQQMYNAALEDSILTSEELRRISGQRMEEERRASGELMEMQRKGQVVVERDMSAMEDFFGGVMTRAREPLAAMSDAALEAFDRLSGISTVNLELDTSSLDATNDSLRRATEALDEMKASAGAASMSGFGKWMSQTAVQSQQIQVQFLAQKASLQSLLEGYEDGSISIDGFIERAKRARNGMGLLNDSDLRTLESAIASAEQRMQALGDSTRNSLEGLLSELDQLHGREDAVAERRFAQRRREMQAQREEARAAGNGQAVADMTRALAVLGEIEAETAQQRFAKQVQAQQPQPAAAPAATPAQQPTTIVRLESADRRRRVDVAVQQSQQSEFLDLLAESALRTN